MEFVIIATLVILGAALVIGGIVGYRGTKRTGARAFSAAAVAAGLAMWAVVLLTTPVSSGSDGSGSADLGTQPVVTGMIVPDLTLTFQGLEYSGVEILGATNSAGEGSEVVCCGIPINADDMAVVGSGTRNNPDGDSTVEVYQPKVGGTNDVYTFNPAQTIYVECEPCRVETTPATWIRWTAG